MDSFLRSLRNVNPIRKKYDKEQETQKEDMSSNEEKEKKKKSINDKLKDIGESFRNRNK